MKLYKKLEDDELFKQGIKNLDDNQKSEVINYVKDLLNVFDEFIDQVNKLNDDEIKELINNKEENGIKNGG